ncbi:MAG: glycosyltransferase family 39 protein, partial [Acidobacteriota bacterium]|nr:glycosyltransferase family 39 protein [Acidobacteriota bacterium]
SYFSATHDFAHTSFFAYMPPKHQWNAQFPTPYFFLQRLFFGLFGATLWTVRLSILPYVALVSGMLFLITRELFDRQTAVVASVIAAFFAVSVYLETFGFMFISSTAVFLVFFYFALRLYRTGGLFEAVQTGVAAGLCYLTYYSSYLALPVLLIFAAGAWLRERSWAAVQNLAIALGGMLLIVSPFVAEGVRSGGYVSRRANEISLLTGQWSPHREAVAKGANPVPIVRDNLSLALAAMAQDGIGGHGGYDFGRRAMFEPFSLALFLLGMAGGLFLSARKPEILFVFVAIGAAFASGVVLTIPPPAYHRFSIAFPFLAIVMAVPFFLLRRIPRLPAYAANALTAGLLMLFACRNERQLAEAAIRDVPFREMDLARLVNQRYPGRPLYIAAFPNFGFGRIYYFSGPEARRRPKVETRYHSSLLLDLNRGEKYVYVMIFPELFEAPFKEADSRGKFFRFSNGYATFAN